MSMLLIAGALGLGLILAGSPRTASAGTLDGGSSGGALEDEDEFWDDADQPWDDPSDNTDNGLPPNVNCDGIGVDGGETDGLVYTEIRTGGASANETLPMVVALHGLGQTKEYLVNRLDELDIRARVIIPDAFHDRTGGRPGRRWYRGSNPGGLQAFMAEVLPLTSEKLAPFVARMRACRPTAGLPVVAGHSQGGYVALDFAAEFPHLVSGVVTSAAWRPVALWNYEPLAPVIAVHGKNDTGVDYYRSLEYYEEMIARGAPLEHRATNGAHSLGTTNLNAWKQAIIDSLTNAGIAGYAPRIQLRGLRGRRTFR